MPRSSQRAPIAKAETNQSDPYGWLRADNWREVLKDPAQLPGDIRAYLDAENAYTDSVMAPLAELQSILFQELKDRLQPDDASVPLPDGAYTYYQRYEAGSQYPLYCRRTVAAEDGADECILLDTNRAASDHAFFQIGQFHHSPDHQHIAYSVDTGGGESYHIIVQTVTGSEVIDTAISGCNGSFVWTADSAGIVYQKLNDNHRADQVFYHRIGTGMAQDHLIYQEEDSTFWVSVRLSDSRRFIQISAVDEGETSDVRLLPRDDPTAAPLLIAPRNKGFFYQVQDHGARLLIRTNLGGTEDYQIMHTSLEQPAPEHWQPLVPHREGCMILGLRVFDRFFVRSEREHATPRVVVHHFDDNRENVIAFDEAAYEVQIVPGMPYAGVDIRLRFSSPKTPATILDVNITTGERHQRKQQRIPSGYIPKAYIVSRLYAEGHDGAQIPITVLHHRDHPIDGSGQLFLQGYGAYGIALFTGFSSHRFSLIDRGMAFAFAHVRGGSDNGYRWHREGKLEHKTNTFRDFIAVAETLRDRGYARPRGIIANGRSAGGMLMGAIANMRPDLFAAIIAEVPFVDVLNTICDASLPLTPPEWNEWGDPIRDADVAARLRSYAPYENVRPQNYPALLVTAGLTDPRVTYWEPAKWVARLRALKTDDNPLLLWTHMGAGHAGASGRYDYLHEIARVYAFALWQAGLHETDV